MRGAIEISYWSNYLRNITFAKSPHYLLEAGPVGKTAEEKTQEEPKFKTTSQTLHTKCLIFYKAYPLAL